MKQTFNLTTWRDGTEISHYKKLNLNQQPCFQKFVERCRLMGLIKGMNILVVYQADRQTFKQPHLHSWLFHRSFNLL